jgi:hypothetical protein
LPAAALGRAGCRRRRATASCRRGPAGTGQPTSARPPSELRAALVAQRERVAELERDAARAHEREGELRGALGRLAAAGPRQRRRLTAELRDRGLL